MRLTSGLVGSLLLLCSAALALTLSGCDSQDEADTNVHIEGFEITEPIVGSGETNYTVCFDVEVHDPITVDRLTVVLGEGENSVSQTVLEGPIALDGGTHQVCSERVCHCVNPGTARVFELHYDGKSVTVPAERTQSCCETR